MPGRRDPRRRIAAGPVTRPSGVPPTARSGGASAPRRAPTTLRLLPDPRAGEVTGEAWGSGAEWVAGPAAPDARRRRRPVRLRAAARADRRRLAAPPQLAPRGHRPRDGVAGAGDHRAEGDRPGGVRRLPRAGAPVRRARARTAQRAGARGAALGAALARRTCGRSRPGSGCGCRSTAPARARSSTPPGSPPRSSGPAGRRPRSSTGGCARFPASGSGRAPRCARGRWATPTRSASATTTSPPTSATC